MRAEGATNKAGAERAARESAEGTCGMTRRSFVQVKRKKYYNKENCIS